MWAKNKVTKEAHPGLGGDAPAWADRGLSCSRRGLKLLDEPNGIVTSCLASPYMRFYL